MLADDPMDLPSTLPRGRFNHSLTITERALLLEAGEIRRY